MSKHRKFIFGVGLQVDGSLSQPTYNKPSLKVAWLRHVTRFKVDLAHRISFTASLCFKKLIQVFPTIRVLTSSLFFKLWTSGQFLSPQHLDVVSVYNIDVVFCQRSTDGCRSLITLSVQLCLPRQMKDLALPFLYALTLSYINRFSKLFYCQNQEKIRDNTITNIKIPPHLKCVATLPSEMSSVLKATIENMMTSVS